MNYEDILREQNIELDEKEFFENSIKTWLENLTLKQVNSITPMQVMSKINKYVSRNFGLFGDTTSSYTDRLGCMETSIDSSGNVTTYMRAYKNTASSSTEGHITVNYPASGSPYATCPTPTEDTNNSVQIDTVGARNTKLAGYVDTSTNQNIGGTKRFTDSVQSQYAWNISRDDFTKGDIPTSTKYFGIMGLDALPQDSSSTAWQDKRLGIVESAVDTNGTTSISSILGWERAISINLSSEISSVVIAALSEPLSRILSVKSRVSIPLIPGVLNSLKNSSNVF